MSHTTTPLHLALAWGFVGIPLAWGVIQTVINALNLCSDYWAAVSSCCTTPSSRACNA